MKEKDVKIGNKYCVTGTARGTLGHYHAFDVGDIVEVRRVGGHDQVDCRGKGGLMQWVYINDLEPIASKQVCKDKSPLHILIHREGLKTIVEIKQKGKSKPICRTEAKCDPNDEYNILTGAQIALQRAYEKIGKTLVMPIPRGCSAKLEPYFV